MTESITRAGRRFSGIRGWLAVFGGVVLWAATGLDLILWMLRLGGGFSSKMNLLSHIWPYISFGGALAGLLARGMPNSLRSIPSVWLLVSLALIHGNQFVPKAALPPPSGPTFRVMTLNLGEKIETRVRAKTFFRRRRNIDVLFLQEVNSTSKFRDRSSLEAALKGRFPHSVWFLNSPSNDFIFGVAILSRYPLREVRRLSLPAGRTPLGKCEKMGVLAAKMALRGRTVRLVTAHLCPPSVPWQNYMGKNTGLTFGSISRWLGAMGAFEYSRRSQIGFLRTMVQGGVEPLVLGGDLNSTPSSLGLLQFSGVLKSAYAERGLGLGFTYSLGFLGARIDHIFHTGDIAARSAAVSDVDISDHKPIEAVLELLPRNPKRPPAR